MKTVVFLDPYGTPFHRLNTFKPMKTKSSFNNNFWQAEFNTTIHKRTFVTKIKGCWSHNESNNQIEKKIYYVKLPSENAHK